MRNESIANYGSVSENAITCATSCDVIFRVAKSEVHFFSRYNNYRQGLDWYRRVMPYSRADQLTIEKTPAYFHSPSVPQRIHDMNSSIKLVLLVRDPVKRAVSDFIQAHQNYPFYYDYVRGCSKFEVRACQSESECL